MSDPSEEVEARIIICPDCGGEGLWEVPTGYYDDRNGALITHTRVCKTCGGSCQVEAVVEPITMEDLATIQDDEADPYSAFAYRGGNP